MRTRCLGQQAKDAVSDGCAKERQVSFIPRRQSVGALDAIGSSATQSFRLLPRTWLM